MKNEILLDYNNEIKRKKFHLLSFFVPLYYILFPDSVLIFVSLLTFIVIIIDLFRLYFIKKSSLPIIKHLNDTIRPYEKNHLMSATLLVITSLIIILFFSKEISILVISTAAICDTTAAIYGLKYGNIKLLFNKTFEGSFAFLISGFILILLLGHIIEFNLDIIFLLIAILIATLVEAITPTQYDNISVPLSMSLILHLFYLS